LISLIFLNSWLPTKLPEALEKRIEELPRKHAETHDEEVKKELEELASESLT